MTEEIKKLPIQYAKVSNPTAEDLHFKYDSALYVLKAGESEDKWTVHHAKHAAKKLADKNIKTSNPEEHRVLMGSYLENSDADVIAKKLGIDLGRIRKEALTKEKAKSRLINLEAQMAAMNEESKALREEMKAMKEKKVKSTEIAEEKEEDQAPILEKEEEKAKPVEVPFESVEPIEASKEDVLEGEPKKTEEKVDKRTKKYKESQLKK